jgi:hypothetical protein
MRAAIRDFIIRLHVLAGGLLGLWWALEQPSPAAPASCSSGAPKTDRVSECMNDSLLATFLPYGVGTGTGLLVGCACGVLLARFLVREPAAARS